MEAAQLNDDQEQLLAYYLEVINNWLNIFTNDLNPTEPVFEMIRILQFVQLSMENCHNAVQFLECEYSFHEAEVLSRRCLALPPRINPCHRSR